VNSISVERHPEAPAPGTLMPSHNQMCACCGPLNPGSLAITITAGEGVEVTGQVTITDLQQGAPGRAHGGVLAMVMDELLGSLNWLFRRRSVTAHLGIDYIQMVPVDSTLYLSARAERVDGRKLFTSGEARLNGPDGEVCCRAEALFIQLREQG
jgi:acyl-coenzyme A thioesterase PaaI-like protein